MLLKYAMGGSGKFVASSTAWHSPFLVGVLQAQMIWCHVSGLCVTSETEGTRGWAAGSCCSAYSAEYQPTAFGTCGLEFRNKASYHPSRVVYSHGEP